MAAILLLMAALCAGTAQSLMEFPVLTYEGEAATGKEKNSPSIEFSIEGPSLDMETLASHAEGALAALTDTMGIPLSKPKKKTKHRVSSTPPPQSTTAYAPRVEKEPAPLQQTPCSHLSSDRHSSVNQSLESPKLENSQAPISLASMVPKVGIPTINQLSNQFKFPYKVDIGTEPHHANFPSKSDNLQYINVPSTVDVSTNHQYVNLPTKVVPGRENFYSPSELAISSNLPQLTADIPGYSVDASTTRQYAKLPTKVVSNRQNVHSPSELAISSNFPQLTADIPGYSVDASTTRQYVNLPTKVVTNRQNVHSPSELAISSNLPKLPAENLGYSVDASTTHQYVHLPTQVTTNQQNINSPSGLAMSMSQNLPQLRADIPGYSVDASTTHQYVNVPTKVVTNRQSFNTPSELAISSNLPQLTAEIPGYPHQHFMYAVKENSENFAPLIGATQPHYNSISSLYKQPPLFSHASSPSIVPSTLFGASNLAPAHAPIASTTSTTSLSSPNSPRGDFQTNGGFTLYPFPLSQMAYTIQNNSDNPMAEQGVSQHTQLPPYPYFTHCHRSKSNLPPLSRSVLPRPFTVNYQPSYNLPSSQPFYAATRQGDTSVYVPQDSQYQQ